MFVLLIVRGPFGIFPSSTHLSHIN